MSQPKDQVPSGFDLPTATPRTQDERARWQEANRGWWESHPMRYDWDRPVGQGEFSPEFFQEIDARFFESARRFMPWDRVPFDPLVDFGALAGMDVLEIGIGNGSHAQLLATRARSYTGIDITDYAVRGTARRLERAGTPARVLRMDAEAMDFPDGSFDFVWSWGVIHHTSAPVRVLAEMDRVLRPAGRAVTMVYHRTLLNHAIRGGLYYGIAQGGFRRGQSLHELVQAHTDGALARYYSAREWRRLVSPWFAVERTRVFGEKAEMVPLPDGRWKRGLMRAIPDSLSRFASNGLRLGSYLVTQLKKLDP
jgi:SAM-dependent methyltransferase